MVVPIATRMPLTPLTRAETAVAACARQIRDAILTGEFPAGAKLPPERDLATRLGVNRVTVRNALSQLKTLHLLTARQGSGYLVRDYRRTGSPDLIVELTELAARSGGEALVSIVEDLLHVRRGLARVVLERLAARPPSKVALAQIRQKLEVLEEVVAKGAPVSEIAEADLDVIAAVVACTGSFVLQLCLNPVTSVFLRFSRLQRAMYSNPAEPVLAHRLVLEWLASGEALPSPEFVNEVLVELDRKVIEAFRQDA